MAATRVPCPICGGQADAPGGHYERDLTVNCPRCGKFKVETVELSEHLKMHISTDEIKRAKVSFGVRTMQRVKRERAVFTKAAMDALIAQGVIPTPREQADNIILWMGNFVRPYTGKPASIDVVVAMGVSGAITAEDANEVLGHLAADSLIRDVRNGQGGDRRLTMKGWDRFHELERQASDSRVAFMAMPLGNAEVTRAFDECFAPAVERTGFKLQRVIDAQGAGLIDDQIMVGIRRARFVVCDLTCGNLGAYWEGGFAEGLGKLVFYTCEKGYFAKPGTHFDTNHRNTVLWELASLPDAATRLTAAIRNTFPAEAIMDDAG